MSEEVQLLLTFLVFQLGLGLLDIGVVVPPYHRSHYSQKSPDTYTIIPKLLSLRTKTVDIFVSCLFVFLPFICIYNYLSVCLANCIYIYIFIYFYKSINLSIYLSVCLFIYHYIYLSVY